ncbi:MAG: hypothetical protein KC912_10750 [Proteobacteria bacterium]|nr:hypothetical protein [Pseudomonadota bacterium]
MRQDLKRLIRDDLPEKVDLRREDREAIRQVVWRRRAADKLNPFIRWAKARTANLPVESRISRMRSVLPDGLIGEHAVSHLEWDAHFRVGHVHERFPVYRWWGEAVVTRLLRVAPRWREDLAVSRLVEAQLRERHQPAVWWVVTEHGLVRLVSRTGPPKLTADFHGWVDTLREAASVGWSVYVGPAELRGVTPGDVVGAAGAVFDAVESVELSRATASARRGWQPHPGRHPEWLKTAGAIAWLYESGWRTTEAIVEALEDGTVLPHDLR